MGGRKRMGGRRTKARDATDLVRVHDLHVLTISLLLLSIIVVNYWSSSDRGVWCILTHLVVYASVTWTTWTATNAAATANSASVGRIAWIILLSTGRGIVERTTVDAANTRDSRVLCSCGTRASVDGASSLLQSDNAEHTRLRRRRITWREDETKRTTGAQDRRHGCYIRSAWPSRDCWERAYAGDR